MKPPRAATIDEYLTAVAADKRAALEKLRRAIRAAAPDAEEYINYGVPAFRLNGKMLVAFGAGANHCSFFPTPGPIEAHRAELQNYDLSKGTIRFAPERPLPAALVRKLVKAAAAALVAKAPIRATSRSAARPNQADPAVAAFLRALDHPRKKDIAAVRAIILGISPDVREGIKWNAPSYRTTDDFATLNLRDGRVWLILHTGAKKKPKKPQVADPDGLLKWLAPDRCLVTFADGKEVRAKRVALEAVLREWIQQL